MRYTSNILYRYSPITASKKKVTLSLLIRVNRLHENGLMEN